MSLPKYHNKPVKRDIIHVHKLASCQVTDLLRGLEYAAKFPKANDALIIFTRCHCLITHSPGGATRK